jgi:hypothetical protein
MSTAHTLTRIIAGVLLSGGVAVAGLGLAAGTAQADPVLAPLFPAPALSGGPYRWCPGQRLPSVDVGWDMNVCHTWYRVNNGQGNVGHDIWDGSNPFASGPARSPSNCDLFFRADPGS